MTVWWHTTRPPHSTSTEAAVIRAIWGCVCADLFLCSHFSLSKLSDVGCTTFIPTESGSCKNSHFGGVWKPQRALWCSYCAPRLNRETHISTYTIVNSHCLNAVKKGAMQMFKTCLKYCTSSNLIGICRRKLWDLLLWRGNECKAAASGRLCCGWTRYCSFMRHDGMKSTVNLKACSFHDDS